MRWPSITQLFPNPRQWYAREQRLNRAYHAVFHGSPTQEDQALVLTNLAYLTGFSMVSPPATTDAELRHNEGKRTVFALIRARLNLTPQDYDAIDNAARHEAALIQSMQ